MVAAERVAAMVSQGVHGRRRVGQGETFWQFRRYQPGDSTQRIDWRQSAKSVPVYIRETEWEAAQSVWLWRDASPSMAYRGGDDRPTKAHRADILLLALAALLLRGGEHVTVFGSGLPPASGRSVLERLATVIEGDQVPDDGLPAYEHLPRYARLVLIGDFLSPLEAVKKCVDGFAAGGVRGHLLQVLDPAEEALPFAGRVHFQGMERDGDVVIGRVETVRDDYQARMAAHQGALGNLARAAGWTFATHHTDVAPQSALMALYAAMTIEPGA